MRENEECPQRWLGPPRHTAATGMDIAARYGSASSASAVSAARSPAGPRHSGRQTLSYDLFDEPVVDSPVSQYAPMDDLLRESDIVTLHTDLNRTTIGLIGERELNLMKPTAYLVNTSRGPVVDQVALTNALKANRIAGAGLDVVEVEPPPAELELLALPNALVFPHSATATWRRAARCAISPSATCWQ